MPQPLAAASSCAALLSVATLWVFIYAVSLLSLADAYTIFMSAPLLITALSVPMLGEHVGWRRWIAVLVGLRRRHHRAEADRRRTRHDRRSRGARLCRRLRAERDHHPHPVANRLRAPRPCCGRWSLHDGDQRSSRRSQAGCRCAGSTGRGSSALGTHRRDRSVLHHRSVPSRTAAGRSRRSNTPRSPGECSSTG